MLDPSRVEYFMNEKSCERRQEILDRKENFKGVQFRFLQGGGIQIIPFPDHVSFAYKEKEMKDMAKGKLIETKGIEDGKHEGIILNFSEKDREKDGKKFKFIDAEVSVDDMKKADGSPQTLKYGMGLPKGNVGSLSKFGKFLLAMGVKLEEGYDTDSLIGKKVSFLTLTDEKGYARITNVKKA